MFFSSNCCISIILFFTFALMKQMANPTNHCIYSQETTKCFLGSASHFSLQKCDDSDLCSPAAFLFQEKLPIIYANIRD